MEDRALRGRTSSADAALQTAGVVAYGRPGPKGRNLPEQVQSEKSQGVRGTESPDYFDDTVKKTENYVSVFSGEVQSHGLALSSFQSSMRRRRQRSAKTERDLGATLSLTSKWDAAGKGRESSWEIMLGFYRPTAIALTTKSEEPR